MIDKENAARTNMTKYATKKRSRHGGTIMKAMKPDEKGVIFSQFTKYLDLIGQAVKEAGHSFVRIDGSVPATKRSEYIHNFNADDGPTFILCSLLASGTGINLTRGNYAFMMDCWW